MFSIVYCGSSCSFKNASWISEIAQKSLKVAVKPGNLSLICDTHMWKERPDSYKLSSDLHMCVVVYTHTHTHTHTHTPLLSQCSVVSYSSHER